MNREIHRNLAIKCNATLALNVKDAGLQPRLTPLIARFGILDYFTFARHAGRLRGWPARLRARKRHRTVEFVAGRTSPAELRQRR
ncbi:hypothetical protein GGD83_004950 [Rhodoblastus sphagnicola]|uniref:hypothetical protein n=1 Tax=Rhodoblastus sphagnicola TaxID=333368 RepID=UPI0011B01F78|nr:hypothetical protein [Rhodoblastus sphagnicola]MBB4201112.1 hypothetical protein [Rhodoblastus sphagnicola]